MLIKNLCESSFCLMYSLCQASHLTEKSDMKESCHCSKDASVQKVVKECLLSSLHMQQFVKHQY